jgi:hypothetical protein
MGSETNSYGACILFGTSAEGLKGLLWTLLVFELSLYFIVFDGSIYSSSIATLTQLYRLSYFD